MKFLLEVPSEISLRVPSGILLRAAEGVTSETYVEVLIGISEAFFFSGISLEAPSGINPGDS